MRTRLLMFAAASTFSIGSFAQEASTAIAPTVKGKFFNPDISANFLGLLQYGSALSTNRNEGNHEGISLQEAELQFVSDVDPYLRASVLFAVAKENGEWGIDPEEVFLETTSLPSVSIRAGKFKMAMGKHNLLHTHAYPFIDAPLIHQQLLGEEGLNESGVSAAVLMPTSWFSEITLQAFDAGSETLYNSPVSGSLGSLLHLKNLVDLSDSTTAELGLSGTQGKNAQNETAQAFGADLTFKWRGSKTKAFIWSTEYLYGNRKGLVDETTGGDIAKLGGLATWVQAQVSERWWLETRYEQVGLPKPADIQKQTKVSALAGFFPSEFSGLRLQYSWLKTAEKTSADHYVGLQYNVSIGAHPAHAY